MSTDVEAVTTGWFLAVREWNEERGLHSLPYDHQKQVSFVIEEIIESLGHLSSEDARTGAEFWAETIASEEPRNVEDVVDSWADIIVYATGALLKLGYDPEKVMLEVLKAISSRTGQIIDGKFVKDLDAVRYEPDYSTCLLPAPES